MENLITLLGFLIILGILLSTIIIAAKIIKGFYSFIDKRSWRKRIRRSRPSKADLLVLNRPGKHFQNFSDENEKKNNRNQYPKYFE
jgi:hypothetical protein